MATPERVFMSPGFSLLNTQYLFFLSLDIWFKIMQAEDYSQSLVFQEGRPIDLTEFKQVVRL